MSLTGKIQQRFCSACLLIFLCVGLVLSSHAQTKDNINIVVALSKNTHPYQQFHKQLEAVLIADEQRSIRIFVIYADIIESISELYDSGINPDFIVAAGNYAARELIKLQLSAPIIFSLLPGSSYQNNIQNSPYCRIKNRCSAVYLEQPIDRQFSIIKKGLPDIQTLGIILGPSSFTMRDSILRAEKKYGINVSIELAKEGDNLILLADSLSKTNEALLAIPDPYVYNRKTAKGILISTYKYQIPFIGYSHGFVHAGALFSIYSTPGQIAKQTGMMLIEAILSPQKELPSPEYPDAYMVEANPAVMRSLRARINFDKSILNSQ
ncbi:hypothetical protein MNBD_GAMMA24-2249 [hydrothermal vent metagenome]|uniref:ABC transporter substrate-binding protein n=1 Tax=hydrothermal vent metagenome TaxID=652676 RepID=A0A3B1BUI6_9ZZZZ